MKETLAAQLAQLPAGVKQLLERHHFDAADFLSLADRLLGRAVNNQVQGEVTPPAAADVQDLPSLDSTEGTRLAQLGEDA
ncbi:MAG TPA: hypothetical protein VHO25_16315, partial [Polyangiaceae bacterium]|nr:hypothetical protein [Polyangiaceae bacterium]